MAAVDNAARLRATALAVIDKQCLGEDIGFDAAPMVGQDPANRVVILYTLILTKKNPLLGQPPLAHVVHIPSPDPTPEQVEQAVGEAIKGLRELTSKLLTDGQQQTTAPNRSLCIGK